MENEVVELISDKASRKEEIVAKGRLRIPPSVPVQSPAPTIRMVSDKEGRHLVATLEST